MSDGIRRVGSSYGVVVNGEVVAIRPDKTSALVCLNGILRKSVKELQQTLREERYVPEAGTR